MRQNLTGYRPGPSRTMMRAKYLSALVLIAVLAFGEYVVTDHLIEAQEHHARFLEQSARQRILLERIALLSHQLISASEPEHRERIRLTLGENLREMRATHTAMVRSIVSYDDLAGAVRRSQAGYTDQPFKLGTQLHLYAASVDSLLSEI